MNFSFIPQVKEIAAEPGTAPFFDFVNHQVEVPIGLSFHVDVFLKNNDFEYLRKIYLKNSLWLVHSQIAFGAAELLDDKHRDDVRVLQYPSSVGADCYRCMYPFIVYFVKSELKEELKQQAIEEFDKRYPYGGTSSVALQISPNPRPLFEAALLVSRCVVQASHPYLRGSTRFASITERSETPFVLFPSEKGNKHISRLVQAVALFIPGLEGVDDFHTEPEVLKVLRSIIRWLSGSDDLIDFSKLEEAFLDSSRWEREASPSGSSPLIFTNTVLSIYIRQTGDLLKKLYQQ